MGGSPSASQEEEVKPEPSADRGGAQSKASAFYSDSIAKIIFGTEKESPVKKKRETGFRYNS